MSGDTAQQLQVQETAQLPKSNDTQSGQKNHQEAYPISGIKHVCLPSQ